MPFLNSLRFGSKKHGQIRVTHTVRDGSAPKGAGYRYVHIMYLLCIMSYLLIFPLHKHKCIRKTSSINYIFLCRETI